MRLGRASALHRPGERALLESGRKRADLLRGRQRRLSPHFRDRQRADHRRAPHGFHQRLAGGQRGGQPAVEGVAGGGAVNGLDVEAGDEHFRLRRRNQRSLGAAGDDHLPRAGLAERRRGPARACLVADGNAGQALGLRLVGRQHGDPLEQAGWKRRRRRRIEDHRHARGRCQRRGVFDHGHGNLQLQQDGVGRANRLGRGIDLGRRDREIRPRRHGDAVFSPAVDENQGHAGVALGIEHDVVGADAFLLEVLNRLAAENVVAHLGHEGHLGAEPGGGDRLVGPLSPGRHEELPAGDRLAGGGNPLGLDDHVGVDASDNDNPGFAHGIRLPTK